MEKQIIKARPSLRAILPVVFHCTVVFAVFNVFTGFGLFLWHPTTVYPLVAPTQQWISVWAVLFITLGIAQGLELVRKRFEAVRGLLALGEFYQLLWSVALLFRVRDGGTLLIAVLFITIAALKAVIILFFLPPDEANNDDRPGS